VSASDLPAEVSEKAATALSPKQHSCQTGRECRWARKAEAEPLWLAARWDPSGLYEEDLARESAFISAQTELLQNLGAALWAYQAKGLAVSYAGAYAPERLKERWQA
jgi:hypothetical protein